LVGLWLAARPADRGHPYGHHKFEVVAAGVVGVSLLLMAFDVARGAIERLFETASPLPRIDAGAFVVLAVTLAINVFVASYQRRRGEQLDSVFLVSDAVHTRSDVLVTIGVLVTVGLIQLGHASVDLIAALVISGFIAGAGVSVLRKNLGYLADAALLAPERVAEIVLAVGGVAGTHKIRTRGSPGKVYVDLHIQIAPHLDVVRAHKVTHSVIDAIKTRIPASTTCWFTPSLRGPASPIRPCPRSDEVHSAASMRSGCG
jgi:cation diffusion facilitator family transporter